MLAENMMDAFRLYIIIHNQSLFSMLTRAPTLFVSWDCTYGPKVGPGLSIGFNMMKEYRKKSQPPKTICHLIGFHIKEKLSFCDTDKLIKFNQTSQKFCQNGRK